MPLFHPKTLTKSLTVSTIPEPALAIINDWASSISSKAIYSQKEVALSGQFVQKILVELLGYTHFSDNHQQWNLTREQQLAKGSVDVALGEFTENTANVLVPFELKGAKTKDLDAIMPGRHKSPVQQAWEYAMDAPGAQWVMVSNFVEIRLYAVGYGRQHYEQWQLAELSDPKEYARFMGLLAAPNLLSGQTRQLLEASDKAEKDITDRLYGDYRSLRLKLITTLEVDNVGTPAKTIIPLAQTLLDRILFIAFAEDRGLLPDKILEQAYLHSDPFNPRPTWDNFKGLFRAIDKGNKQLNIPAYNGGLFADNVALDALNVSDDLCEGFKELGDYDFESEVSVTVLGHIFEQSISDLEAIHEAIDSGEGLQQSNHKQTATTGKRKQHGVVYTPDSITRFIVEHTLGRYIDTRFNMLLNDYTKGNQAKYTDDIAWKNKKAEQQFWRQWREALMQIKIVDPACGSGAFLVAAFDYLAVEYRRINEKLLEITGTNDIFDLDKEILSNNLYGVDINAESIEISKLSLWLKTAKRGKALTSLDANIQHGNSLVFTNDSSVEQGFNWQAAFAQVFEQGGFDVVLGNPPYVRQERLSDLKPWLQTHFAVYHGVVDLYAYFYELGLKLLKPGGQLGYISSSTFFKTSSGEALRGYLSQHSELQTIIDFGDLQLFEGVTTYPTIVIARQQRASKQHSFPILTISGKQLPSDLSAYFYQHQQTMQQQQLSAHSWRLESATLAALRDKLTTGHASLKQQYGSPLYGIKTGYNEAFVINRQTRDRLIAEDPRSSEILKPFLEGKDLKKWHSEPRGLSLILFPKGWTRKQSGHEDEANAWNWLQQNYPAICNWLNPFMERAKKRGDKGEFWWELRACAYYEQFEGPKVIYPVISQGAKFSLEKNLSYSNDKTFIFPSGEGFLSGILSSLVSWFIVQGICSPLRGGVWRYELRAQDMETLPIPSATAQQKEIVGQLAERCQTLAESRYALEHGVRQRIPDLCPDERDPKLSKKLINWWQLDFAAFRKEIKRVYKADIAISERNEWEQWLTSEAAKVIALLQQLNTAETQLNQHVYSLFNLTTAEIALIEASTH